MADQSEEDLNDSGELEVDLESDFYSISDLENLLFIPLDVLKSLEESPEFSIVANKVLEYVSKKENETHEYTEVVQHYQEKLEERSQELKDLERLQNEIECLQEVKNALEERNNELTDENEAFHEQTLEFTQTLSSSKEEIEKLTNDVTSLQMTIEDKQEELDKAQLKIEELKPPPDIPGADRDELLRLLDRRQHEITQLSNDWMALSEKLESRSSEKQNIQFKLDEFMSQEASIRLREQLLVKEKMLIQQQNDWLTKELEVKNSELFALRKEMSTTLNEKDTSISHKDDELTHLRSSVASKSSLIQELQGRLDSTHKRLIEATEEQANVEDKLRRELAAQSKLTSLYQSASEDGEKIVKELMSKLESLQMTLDELSNEKETALRQAAELDEKFACLQSESSERISTLENELKNANDLLTAARHRGALPFTETEVLSISPAAAATSSHLLSGLSLTQIYTKYVESNDELRLVKDENLRLNNYLTQIMEELDEKTPALQKLRRDHDMLLQRCQDQQLKLESVLEECENIRLESEESIKSARISERENKRLKSLVGDLGQQVKTLLKECEEARGGVVSTSYDWSGDISSDTISSSSQVISEHLVTFRGIEELQEQNQKLLAVVRELSETKEKEEREYESEATKELRDRLDAAVKELSMLRESREKQKEMVESIVKQRDMYRILLAQSTPLPQDDDTSQLNISQDSTHSLPGSTPQKNTSMALQELKEQFEAYRKEKATNDSILQEQINEYRDEAAATRLDNAKLVSKLEYANERYQMLESTFKELKNEMSALRNKEKIMTASLTKHQSTVNNLTQELLTARQKLSHLEVKHRSLQTERDMLFENEKSVKQQYEHLMKEQKAQNLLLTNLQTIQNNLERSEFETKSRLTSQVQVLEKETSLLKEKLHNEEERREKIKDAYETQVQDLSQRLSSTQTHETELIQSLSLHKEMVNNLETELTTTQSNMQQIQAQLDEANDRLRAMEEDAGAEFRDKVRVLERKVSDSKNKITSLEEQLTDAQSHSEQYKSMSEANERALQELNVTSEEFKNKLTEQIDSLKSREEELLNMLETLREEKEKSEADLKDELKQTQEALVATQEVVAELSTRVDEAEKNMTEAQNDQTLARQDAKRCTELAREHQELYQRELVQHGHTMEQLSQYVDKEEERELEVTSIKEEMLKLKEELTVSLATQNEVETRLLEEKEAIEERCKHLTAQNDLLHSEAEKLSARIVTLTQQESDSIIVVTKTVDEGGHDEGAGSDTPTNVDHLWEVIRFVRREKEIAETKREMAESEAAHLNQVVVKLQQQLAETKSQLQELADATKAHEETAAQYEDIMSKIQTLNVLNDSNRLIREEKDSLAKQVELLKEKHKKDEQQIQSLLESQRLLTSQKDSLLAEKVALKHEVERWNTRTNQLIEQYNKIDPEEYKQLVEEKSLREEEMSSLKQEMEVLSQGKSEVETELSKVKEELEEMNRKKEEEIDVVQTQLKTHKDELTEKNKLVAKLKELGRKYRSASEELKKKVDENQQKIEENEKTINELENEKADLQSQLEEAKKTPPELNASMAELQTQFDQVKGDCDKTKVLLAEKEDKLGKVIKTARTLKGKLDTMKTEKDNLEKDFAELKQSREQLLSHSESQESSISTLQGELDNARQQYSTDTKRLEERIEKLEQDLRSSKVSTVRRQAPVVSIESPSTTVTLQQAPTAAVRPTVTTTPTASIRPMPLQTTSAPTAHVTPTQVTTSIPATSEALPTQSTSTVGSAAVFMRSTSPLVVTQTLPQATPISSNASEVGGASSGPSTRQPIDRPIKRSRESLESEQLPTTKRIKQVTSEAEPSTTTDHTPSAAFVDTPMESSMTAPDTQTDQEPSLTRETSVEESNVADEDTIETVDDGTEQQQQHRRTESMESEIVADTTSEEASEAMNSEAQPPPEPSNESERVDEPEPQVTMATAEPEVTMATEPTGTLDDNNVIVVEDESESQGDEEEELTGEVTREASEEEEDYVMVDPSDDEISESGGSPRESQDVYVETTPQIIEEQSMGLPDDEITMEIPTPSTSSVDQPPSSIIVSTGQQQQLSNIESSRRLRLALAERAHTPGTSIDTLVAIGDSDHQVPCTPILAEDKQLGKPPAPQSVPGPPPPPPVSTLVVEQSHHVPPTVNVPTSSQAEAISSLGETQLEELSSTTGSIQPVPATTDLYHDTSNSGGNAVVSQVEDEQNEEDMIEDIINQDSSGEDDIEEGELADSQPVAEEVGAQPTSSSMAAASSQESTRTEKRPTVIERIVWDQPSTSTSQFEGGEPTTQRPSKAPKIAQRRPLRARGRGKGRGGPPRKW